MALQAIEPTNALPATRLAPADGPLFRLSRSNVLFIGPDASLDAAVAAIVGQCEEPAATWPDVAGVNDSAVDRPGATVIVRNVIALSAAEQEQLHRWLDLRGVHVRIVATTPEPLYPLVRAQRFLEPLYYRLNIICVTADDLAAAGRPA